MKLFSTTTVVLFLVGLTARVSGQNLSDADASGTVAPRPVGSADNVTSPSETPAAETNGNVSSTPDPTVYTPEPCTSSEDCADGTFCSSLTSTCLTLNCTNWAVGFPEGETSYSETPCISDEDIIEAEAGFCGWDGECHDYGCENWYLYGPTAFTGYNPSDPVELVCEDYANGAEENMNGVVFGCRPYTPGRKAPEALTWTSFFNQKCTAEPSSGHVFECYNYKEDTDFRDYLGEVARLSPPFCDQDVYGGITTQGLYWYNVILAQNRKGEEILYKAGRENTASTSQFDPSEADAAMFAMVTSDSDVPEFGPPPEDDAPPSGGAANGKYMFIGTVVYGLVIIAALIL